MVGHTPAIAAFLPCSAPADRPALSFPEGALTHGQLRAAACRVAEQLAGSRRVAIPAALSIETPVAVAGALLAGVPAVPLNPSSGAAELAHVVADADPDAVLVAPGAPVPAALADRRVIPVELGNRGTPASGPPLAADVDETAPALIVYTSGTTGPPKGVVLPRRGLAANLDALAGAWDWTERDVVAHALPLFHVHGLVVGILGPLRRGGTAVHLGRFSVEAVRDALGGPATMLFAVPTMYRRLADAAEDSPELAAALRRARLLVSGSAALPPSVHARLRERTGRDVVERYGLTETLMNTAVRADAPPRPGSVGPPLDGVEIRLIDDDGREPAAGDSDAIGEVHVRGPNVFSGYLNRPEATDAVLRDGWFATGDMATRDRDGWLWLVGRRATDLIKSGGYKLGAGEIEDCLREHPAVADAAVTGEPDPDLGERAVAWVVSAAGARPGAQELIDHVAAQLAPHKRPRVVRFVAELPRNELGKVQKQRLAG